MALYEMLRADGTLYPHGTSGLYSTRSAFDHFGEIVTDDVARARGLIDPDGFPVTGWIWWPGSTDVR